MHNEEILWALKYLAAPAATATAAIGLASKKGRASVSGALGKTWHAVRQIKVVDDWISRVAARWNNPVVTNLIVDPADPDLRVALALYNKSFPEDQRCDEADMVRWVREDARHRKQLKYPDLTDWYIVAKYKRVVCGLVVFHYSRLSGLGLIAYMVTEKKPGLAANDISAALGARVARLFRRRRELRGCKGFVVEVEDPREASTKRKRDERLARIRRFCTLAETQELSLRAFEFDYKQPRLSLERDDAERRMLLLSARYQGNTNEILSARTEAIECLKFVLTEIYPDGYDIDLQQCEAYRKYCAELMQREVASLPDPLRALSCAQFFARFGRRGETAEESRA